MNYINQTDTFRHVECIQYMNTANTEVFMVCSCMVCCCSSTDIRWNQERIKDTECRPAVFKPHQEIYRSDIPEQIELSLRQHSCQYFIVRNMNQFSAHVGVSLYRIHAVVYSYFEQYSTSATINPTLEVRISVHCDRVHKLATRISKQQWYILQGHETPTKQSITVPSLFKLLHA